MSRIEELQIETQAMSNNSLRILFQDCKTHEEVLAVVHQLTLCTLDQAGVRTKEINRRFN